MLEGYHIALHHLKLDANVLLVGRFVNTFNPEMRLMREQVLPALAHAVHTHAALSVRIVPKGKEETDGHIYERMEKVDLEGAIRFLELDETKEEEDCNALMEMELTDPIIPDSTLGSSRPLWRLTITPNNTVAFAWHHCIGDGQSGLAFLRTLLSGLNEQHPQYTGTDFRAFRTKADLTLVSAIEDLTDLRVSIPTLISALIGLVIPSSWSLRNVWTGNDVAARAGVFKTRVRNVSISPPVAARILAAARAHNTTLTAILYVLGTSALSDLVSSGLSNDDQQFTHISTTVPISLRRLADVPPTSMGDLVSNFDSSELLRRSAFSTQGFAWEHASSYAKALHKGISGTREVIGSLRYLFGRYEGYHKSKLASKRQTSFMLSNVGAFKLNLSSSDKPYNSGDWTISDAFFGQDDGVVGAALKMNTVGAPSGAVNTSVTWGEGTVDDRFAEAFVRNLATSIERLDKELTKEAGEIEKY